MIRCAICGSSQLDSEYVKCAVCGGPPAVRAEQCYINEDTKSKLVANKAHLESLGILLEEHKDLHKGADITLAALELGIAVADSLDHGVLRKIVIFLREIGIPEQEILRLRLDEPQEIRQIYEADSVPTTRDTELIELASGFTVRDYTVAVVSRDKKAIATAMQRRFVERYIEPVNTPKHKHGFTMMAVSCLLIEAFQAFREGWPDTDGKSQIAFADFFASTLEFKEFREYSREFYKHVRSGILHQAETTGGWRITRKRAAPLFDSASLTINAEKFLKNLRQVLDHFFRSLKNVEWDSVEWKNARTKIDALCKNVQPVSDRSSRDEVSCQ